jgi:hypothetical protein
MVCLVIFSLTTALSLSASGASNGSHSTGLENMAQTLRGDVRLIVMGDSFSTPMFARVPLATLRTWPLSNIKAISGGAPQDGHGVRAVKWCSPVSALQWSDPGKYSAMRSSTIHEYFSLPVRGIREIYTNSTFTSGPSGQLFMFRFDDSVMASGLSGQFAVPGDNLRFRFLYWANRDPINTMVRNVALRDYYSPVLVADLLDGARPYWHLGENPNNGARTAIPLQINAISTDISANLDIANTLQVGIFESTPLVGTNKYFNPAGGVYYHADESGARIPGLYYSYLADDGWSYYGYGSDTAPTNEGDRRFSEDQFVHWLDVTTLDRQQPVVFMWYLAPEWIHYDEAKLAIESMLDQTDRVAQRVGISNYQHMLVTPHMFDWGGLGNTPTAHAWMQGQRDAMEDVATERQNVSHASIYDASDGVLFDGTQDGNDWLLQNGFDAFQYGTNVVDLSNGPLGGNFLDAMGLHPLEEHSAAFFSAILGDIIREAGCPADLKADGIIDIEDLLLFINGWEQPGDSDLNEDGITDISDLLILINGWGECWPVQAPFNTPAFRGP